MQPPSSEGPFRGLELLPDSRPVKPLFLLLHDAGGAPADLMPMAEALRRAFPEAAILVPEAPGARAWYAPVPADGLAGAVAAALPLLEAMVRQAQDRFATLASDTALVGFGQGATLALEYASRHDGGVGRVLAFSGRYATLPERAPELTTLHLLHGEADTVVPVARARDAFERLAALGGDATLDVASGVGHELHPVLIARAIERLQTCIPLRHWKRALESLGGA